MNNNGHVSFLYSIANLLRGPYKESQYGSIILPFTVLRRLDCLLADKIEEVARIATTLPGKYTDQNRERFLNKAAGLTFHNTSGFTFKKLLTDPDNLVANLKAYINGFSADVRQVFTDHFKIFSEIANLDKHNILYALVTRFAETDLNINDVPNAIMGNIFEELIRKFAEQSNETAGEHFTPREVIRLMVALTFTEDHDALSRKGRIIRIFDPAGGTGGMISSAEEYLSELNPDLHIELFGQEFNDESYAVCRSDMIMKGQNPKNIRFGNSFSQDQFVGEKFNYMLCNPPYGVEWKTSEKFVREEQQTQGSRGRFGAGLPRISDGQLLFVQHMISKMANDSDPSRIAVIMNGSPLFSGDAGSGESEIRRWILENDWLEALVALPTDLFYNTGIATYIWIITNKKAPIRQGKVQLINATDIWEPTKKSLGSKRKQLTDEGIDRITNIFGNFQENEVSKIFESERFGYRKITIERPLRLNFQVSNERLGRLHEEKAFRSLSDSDQVSVSNILTAIPGKLFNSRESFEKALKKAQSSSNMPWSAAIKKAVMNTLSERSMQADICKDKHGKPESDPELRDTENVPLCEDIRVYFTKEVIPHTPDAWINEDVRDHKDNHIGKVGYEINFNRYFYKFAVPRALATIKGEIRDLEQRIIEKLRRVAQ